MILICVTFIHVVIDNLHGELKMSDVKDYCGSDNNHYNGVSSTYGKRVAEQNRQQPKYCMPGEANGKMQGQKSNKQAGA